MRHIVPVQWMSEISLLNLVTYCRCDRPIHQSLLRGDVFLNSGKMVMPLEILKWAVYFISLSLFSGVSSPFCSLPAACGSFL
jgi:hypothetical protein